MSNIVEIAPDLFRISVFAEAINLQFNHFLVRDEEPVLFHTGLRGNVPRGAGTPRQGYGPGKAAVDRIQSLRVG